MVDDNVPPPPSGDAHGTAADRLNSWKEIAAYLGKGVRTVQRWETQMGLPVRRLGREGGEIVYALKSEIDAWILRGDRSTATDLPREGSEAPPPPPAATRSAFPRWAWSLLLLVGLVGLGMVGGAVAGGDGRGGLALVVLAGEADGEGFYRRGRMSLHEGDDD